MRCLMWFVVCLSFAAGPPRSQCCSLGGPSTTWSDANGSWTVPGNWTSGTPNSSANACIIDGTSTVTLTGSGSVASLQLAGGNGLVVSDGSSFTVTGTD